MFTGAYSVFSAGFEINSDLTTLTEAVNLIPKEMNEDISNTNVSFQILKKSDDFLYTILNNITSCVLLLDRNMRLQAFNDAVKTIFSNRKDEDLLYMRCGEAIGCAYQVEEAVDCGKTTMCDDCELRIAALHSYVSGEVVFKEHITKPFFTYTGEKVDKHLQFSTRLFVHEMEKYIILIVEDITELMETKKIILGN